MPATTVQRPTAAPGLRERKKEQTKNAMIDAALALFAERGYDDVTVQEIADVADVSVTTFFRYFATKEAVLITVGPAFGTLLEDTAAAAPAHLDDLGVFHHSTRTVFSEHFNLDHVRKRYRVSVSTPELRGRVADTRRTWATALVAALQRRHGLAEPTREIQLTVGVGLAVMGGALDEWTATDDATATKEHLLALLDQWFATLRVSGGQWAANG